MMHWPVLLLALSQQSPDTIPVEFGTRVRVVTAASSRPLVGPIVANDSGRVMVIVTGRGSRVSIPLNGVTDLSWSRGRAQRRGSVIGAGVGLLVGAAAYSNAAKHSLDDAVFLGMLAFGAAPGLGAIVGSLSAPERWEPAAVPRARDSSVSAAVTLRFAPQETIRVTTRSARLAGRTEHAAGDTLVLVTSNGAVPLPWVEITDVQVGVGRNRWVGALLGAAIGLVAGVIGESSSPTTGSPAVAFTGVGIAGAVLGAVALSPRRWESLPLPAR